MGIPVVTTPVIVCAKEIRLKSKRDTVRDARRLAVYWAAFLLAFSGVLFAQQDDLAIFGSAVDAVNRHSPLIILSDPQHQAAIAVWPAMQGRVLTSTAKGAGGRSFGWINQQLIASGKVQQHINAVGGEDRLWLGPEGGQFSIFFAKGAPFDLDHWYTPAPIDTEAFDVVAQTPTSVSFRKSFQLTNYSGTHFSVKVDREVKLLSQAQAWSHLGMPGERGVDVVGFESENRLTNESDQPWTQKTGLLLIWILGQFNAAPHATIVLPIRPGPESSLGIPVKRDYFGQVPADRIDVTSSAVFFKADANYRSKLGLRPQRAKGVSGSYDADHHVLTIVQYSMPTQPAAYVNSAWKIQDDPFKGDVANCYNDGPPGPGKPQLGHFYELESSSPAYPLAPHASLSHTHRTIHLVGAEPQLDRVAQRVLGVSLAQVNSAFRQ